MFFRISMEDWGPKDDSVGHGQLPRTRLYNASLTRDKVVIGQSRTGYAVKGRPIRQPQDHRNCDELICGGINDVDFEAARYSNVL